MIDANAVKIIITGIAAWFIAQLIKVIIASVKEKKFKPEFFIGLGGMPSAHAAFVSAITAAIYLLQGVSVLFAVSLAFLIIVLRDAVGVRREVGRHAEILNKLNKAKKLDEKVGHNLWDVLAGIAIGIVVAVILT
ncbi:divergent PAP2 family protein [Candidatus Woesearchaeota archaeon]|nr:divergent PAP2 family protein [Candidatus Woesearchaeota archaeon]